MIVGTAGHVDHGKTALVRALTGVDTDRLKEEKARGITIDLGFAYLPLPGGPTIGFVDVPGHERFVHTMVAGAGAIDFALLVVAADDGVMPQTREHLAILDLLGVQRGLVAMTKADLAGPERRAEVEAGIRALLQGSALEGAEVIPVSVVTGEGLDALRQRLEEAAQAETAHAASGAFRLAVDRCFTLAGAGTVVTGTVLSGRVAVGDPVMVSPAGIPARVRSIHAQNRPAAQGHAGERCALNLAGEGMSREAVQRGDVVLAPGLHAPADRIDAALRLLPGQEQRLRTWLPARLHVSAAEVGARLVPLGPGDRGTHVVQLVLDRPIAAAAGDRFVVRDTSGQLTLGGGRLLDLRAPARRRQTPERLAQLAALAEPDPAQALARLLAGPAGTIDLAAFARDRAMTPQEASALREGLGLHAVESGPSVFVFAPERWARFEADLLARVAAFHAENPDVQGIGAERLRIFLDPRLPAPVFRTVLQDLARSGKLSLTGAWVALPGYTPRLFAQDEALYAAIEPHFRGEARFRPPRVRDLAHLLEEDEARIRKVLKLVARQGRVDEVAHDHFFLRETVAEMTGILRDVTAREGAGQVSAAQFRDRMDNGRKVAIQILEFFDRHGITLRRGDLRRINPHRIDLFGSGIPPARADSVDGGEASPVGRPDFKSG